VGGHLYIVALAVVSICIALANALVQLRSPGLARMGLDDALHAAVEPPRRQVASGGALGARLAFALSGVALTASALVGWRALADQEDDEFLEALLASSAAPLTTASA
jgi:hypothetical protein